ncbi:MAG: cation transporter [Synechococcus sp. BS307-5m-G38]|nr:cation transporter [Synechococcus sp. BS307-5m-G38]
MSIAKATGQQSNFVLLASSIYLVVSVVGFIGSNATDSSALELNSYYNAIAALAGFVSFFILRSFNKDSKRFTFGLDRFIPLLTLVEGLLIFSVSQNACALSMPLIFSGGSENPVNITTLIYSIIISICYFLNYILHLKHTKSVGNSLPLSKLLLSRSLSITIFSVAITVLFGISIVLTQLNILPAAASHIEPIAIFVLVSIAMKGPMGQIFGSMNQLLLGAPQKEETVAINDIVVSRMEGISPENYKVRPTKQGEMLYVSILLSENFADSYPAKVNSLQAIKSMISTDLRDKFPINRIEFSL